MHFLMNTTLHHTPQALGVAIDLGPEDVARCVDEAGIGFMYAPRYHPAMKAVKPIRAALKVC